jgi:hypothetical protein
MLQLSDPLLFQQIFCEAYNLQSSLYNFLQSPVTSTKEHNNTLYLTVKDTYAI